MIEIWKDIPGFEGVYQASNLGRIKSLDREIDTIRGKRKLKGKIVPQRRDSRGKYLICELNKKTLLSHRIIAITFLENPKNYQEVNHLDGNHANNEISNLEWCSRSINMKHAYKENLKVGKSGTPGKPIKAINLLTDEAFIFSSQKEAGRQLNIDESSIRKVLKGERSQAKNYKFERME